MRDVKKTMVTMLVLIAAAAFAACGSSDDSTETGGEESAAVSGEFVTLAEEPASDFQIMGEAELERSNGGTVVSLDVSGLKPKTPYIAHLHTGGCEQPDPGGPHFQFQPGGSEEPPNEIHLEFTADAAGEAKAQTRSKRRVPVGEAGSIVLHVDESHHERTTFEPAEAEAVTAVFVHEGEDHSKEGGHHEQEPQHAPSDKIACAELEGTSEADGGAGPTAETDVPTITVRDGEPVGGVAEIAVNAGDDVRFKVSADETEEVHVHGYDLAQTVPAGGTIEFDFPADLEGIYEVELEKLGVQIAELRVEP